MKKTKIQKMISFAVALMMALTMIISSTAGAFAASPYSVSLPDVMYQGQYNYSVNVYNYKTFKDYTPTSVKSSKPGVIKVTKESWKDEKGKKHIVYFATAKKVGKSTLTVKFKVKGKVKTVKHKITVKKYPKPIKSLKVNKKTVKLTGKQRYHVDIKNKATTAKVKAALNKGWKINSVYGYYYNYKTGKSADYKNEKQLKNLVKSGKAIKFPKKWTNMGIGINMRKGNQFIDYHINLYR